MLNSKIHPTAIITDGCKIGNNVEIGPYSIIGAEVEIGNNNIIKSHVVIDGLTKIGDGNIIFPFASIGSEPQDLKYNGEKSQLIIGHNNKIREYVTINPGTETGSMITKIGNNCLLMISSHIAHDCVVGNNVILANNVTLAGHVEIEDFVVVGGLSAIHQFTRIGKHAIIGGMSGVESDVMPYAAVVGERAFLAGLNLTGLKRRNFPRVDVNGLRAFYKKLFNDEQDLNFIPKVQSLAIEYQDNQLVIDIVKFLTSNTSRSFCKPKKAKMINEGNLS